MAKKQRFGPMRSRLAFDPPKALSPNDGYGNEENGFDTAAAVIRQAEISYQHGGEDVDNGKRTGRGVYRIRIGQSPNAALITADWRGRDLQSSATFDLLEVDALSDPAWIWIKAETLTGVDQ